MIASLPVDPFATKGAEYLLVIGFLLVLALLWRLLARRPAPAHNALPATAPDASAADNAWFSLPLERLYHPGHTWAHPEPDGLITLGIDDFAQKLVGRAEAVTLPEPGTTIEHGRPLSRLAIGAKAVEVLAPVDGEVVERNDAVLERPEVLDDDPYGAGWLLRVRPRCWDAESTGLLKGRAARAWMQSTEDSLRSRMSPGFGLLMQDGGVPISGIARSLAGDDWDELAREYLLS